MTPGPPCRLLVTGAQGFIGSHVLEVAHRLGVARVVAVCATPPWRWSPQDPRFVVHVLSRPWWGADEEIGELSQDADAAVLLDYTPPPRRADPLLHERDVNAGGTAKLAAAIARSGTRVVVASSAEVYAGTMSGALDEQVSVDPRTPYGWAKSKMEQMVADAVGRGTSLRIATTFGAGETRHRAIPAFATALLGGRRPVVHGRGDDVRDYIHVDDVARACVLAAADEPDQWTTYNVGTGQGRSTNEVLATVAAAVGVPARPLHVPPLRPPRTLVLDSGAIGRALGFVATTPFAAGVTDEVAWLRQHQEILA